MKTKNQQTNKPAFKLKGSVLTVSVMQLLTHNLSALTYQLEEIVKKNPNFFNHMPIVIDLQKITAVDHDINFSEINSLLQKNNLAPVGVINANGRQLANAVKAGLGILPNVKTSTTNANPSSKPVQTAKVITTPIRSGQQIYAKDSDLIVLSSVSNGAEVLADGNIHIYGTLRGRAIAGASGDKTARIFCHKLEAELISIAGYYRVQEDIEQTEHPISTQIVLDQEQLVICAVG